MKNNNTETPLYKQFNVPEKVGGVIAYLSYLNAHQTRRTESEYHIVLAYSTIVAGIFVFVTIVVRQDTNLPIWLTIGLSVFLIALGILNMLKIYHSHKIYEKLGQEIIKLEDKVLGFYEDSVYIKCRPLCGFTEKKLGKGPGYKYNVWVIVIAMALSLFVLWGTYAIFS